MGQRQSWASKVTSDISSYVSLVFLFLEIVHSRIYLNEITSGEDALNSTSTVRVIDMKMSYSVNPSLQHWQPRHTALRELFSTKTNIRVCAAKIHVSLAVFLKKKYEGNFCS